MFTSSVNSCYRHLGFAFIYGNMQMRRSRSPPAVRNQTARDFHCTACMYFSKKGLVFHSCLLRSSINSTNKDVTWERLRFYSSFNACHLTFNVQSYLLACITLNSADLYNTHTHAQVSVQTCLCMFNHCLCVCLSSLRVCRRSAACM